MPDILVVLTAADDRTLHAGRVISIPTFGAPMLHVTLAGKRIKLSDAAESSNGARAEPAAPTRLNEQRGPCPYCQTPDVLLAAHIRGQHPGKVIPWLGPNPVKCPRCPRTFPSMHSMRVHNYAHAHKKPAKKPGGTQE